MECSEILYFNPPQITEMSHTIILESWEQREDYYRKYMPEKIEMLSKYMGHKIWDMGYIPFKTTFIEECNNYNKHKPLGISCDVKMEKTYAQRFFPLFYAYEKAVEELKRIKQSWWYRLFELFGIIKSERQGRIGEAF